MLYIYKLSPWQKEKKMSIDQFVVLALSAQIWAWITKDYLEEKANRSSWEKFQQVLTKVPNVEPEDYDKVKV